MLRSGIQHLFGQGYEANGQWRSLIADTTETINQNLVSSLENFFREEKASSGICEYANWHLLSQKTHVMSRIIFVNAMLHDYETWKRITRNTANAIETPALGNAWGYPIDGVLAAPASFRHHYTAEKAIHLMDECGVLAELGGGWGDVGYYALRYPGMHYVDFDLPEVLILASYWLCSALPDRKILLYGENEGRGNFNAWLDRYDAILMPNFCFKDMPNRSAKVFMNTRSLSEMQAETVQEYLGHISRTCASYFLHENSDTPYQALGHTEIRASTFRVEGFRVLNESLSPWKSGGGRYHEFLMART